MIRIDRLSVRLPGFSLEEISLDVAAGEFFCLLGPTGAGKTLILETVAGLVPPTGGTLTIAGRDVTRLPPEKRGVGIVYQDCALFPHLTVRENILYGLRYRRRRATAPALPYAELLDRMGIGHLESRSVTHLSGGERQRVALARALTVSPEVLLLDEPLSALDPNFREEIRDLLRTLHRETGITVLMVTHDFAEALALARRAALVRQGRLEQIGPVSEIFQRPATPFVAGFVGTKNVFPATVAGNTARVGELCFTHDSPPGTGGSHVAIRPERFQLAPPEPHGTAVNRLKAEVVSVTSNGLYASLSVRAAGLLLAVLLPADRVETEGLAEGRSVALTISPEHVHVMGNSERQAEG